MLNTECNLNALSAIMSSDASFQALAEIIDDLGLEFVGTCTE